MGTNFIMVLTATAIIGVTVPSCNRLCASKAHFPGLTGGAITCYPVKDSILVGDTLVFNALIPVKLKYRNGTNPDSSVVDMSGAYDVSTDIHFTNPVGIQKSNFAVDSFSIIGLKGSIQVNPIAPHFAKTVTFVEENGMFKFSMFVMALKPGVYCITIINIFSAKTNCSDASISIVFNNTDQHLHYLQDIFYGGGVVDSYDQTNSYCFKVK